MGDEVPLKGMCWPYLAYVSAVISAGVGIGIAGHRNSSDL